MTIFDHALPKGWLATSNLVLAWLVSLVCRLHPFGAIGLAGWVRDLRDVRSGFRALAGSECGVSALRQKDIGPMHDQCACFFLPP